MPTLIFRDDPSERDLAHAFDVGRIVQACANAGYTIRADDARRAWDACSDSSCSSWITLPDDEDDIVRAVLSHCDEQD